MQKHGVILDMSCDKLTFWLSHNQYSRMKRSLILPVKKLGTIQIHNKVIIEEPHAKPYQELHSQPHVRPTNNVTLRYIILAK